MEVLRTFATLAEEQVESAPTSVLSGGATFLWQRYRALNVFEGKSISPSPMPVGAGLGSLGNMGNYEGRVLGTAKLHAGERRLLVGWIWFSGTLIDAEGTETMYCFPAVSVPVDFESPTGSKLIASGDVVLTDLVRNSDARDRLLLARNFGDGELRDLYLPNTREYTPVPLDVFPTLDALNSWIDDIAKEIGLPVGEVKAAHQGNPIETIRNNFITVHIGSALYLEPPESFGPRSDGLLALGGMKGVEKSALATLYDRTPLDATPVDQVAPIRPLSIRQASIAADALGSDLSVLTGAPGTGKSHVLSVIAMNAIERGESVLVVAGSAHAVDVLAEHFVKTPGPPPVIFGGSRYGQELARDLAELASRGAGVGAVVDTGREDLEEHNRLLASVHRLLAIEQEAVRMQRDPSLRIELMHARERAGDLNQLGELIDRCDREGPRGWLSRKRHQKSISHRLGGAADQRKALQGLRRGADAQRLDADGGLSLTDMYDAMVVIEESSARQRGRAMSDRWRDGIDAAQRSALAQISTALTSSRTVRRQMLADLDPAELTRAAPLWVGSIRDVEDILPNVPGLFDVLLIDEGAQVDQLGAVHALVRANRLVICGDPRQLGHVSYMSDGDRDLMQKQELTDGEILDVERVSLFDVGSSRVPSLVLDEHFRSAPHIIEFSARRMYDGRLHVVGRNPLNEAADHIHIEYVDGARNAELVNGVEVEACIVLGERAIADGYTSIGFVSPFEEQAQALEEAILDRWQLEEIDAYGLRVGTVHGFQGDERDVIIASWAIGPDEGANVWSFVNQPNLFNVMVTRARDQVYVVTSTEQPPGLAGDYIRWSEPLTDLVRDVTLNDPWITKVAEVLREAGHSVRVGYSVGRHHIDLVVENGSMPIAIDCLPHSEGPAAHSDRAMQLRRLGWRALDLFESRWGERVGEIALELERHFDESTPS